MEEAKEVNYELEEDQPKNATDVEADLEIVDDTPEEDKNKKHLGDVDVPEEEIEQYSTNVQKRINQLKRAYHDERREKEKFLREQQEAMNYAQSIQDQNKKLQEQLKNGETVLVESQKERVDARISQAEKEYKDAYEAGDPDKMVKAQKDIARYAVQQREVETYRPVYQAPLQQQENPVQQQVIPDDRTKQWVENNRWFETDAVMRGAAFGVHDQLVAKGVQAGTEEYFTQIDSVMRENFPEKFGTRKPANVVAPASRSSGSTKVKLTKTQVSIAKRLGVPLEKYAEHVMKEQANG
tara:strand:+ start:3213 stop:4100 length:888 start_codon:yes stop_codon:yes gene_type:complete